MAYKFQLGQAKLSGSIVQTDGTLDANASTVDSLDVSSGGISNAGAIGGVSTVSGSGKFEMGSFAVGGTDVTSTAAELNILDGVTANKDEINLLDGATSGTAVAGKALVVDESSDIDSIGNLSATQLSASAAVLAGGDITGSSGLFIGGLADFQDSIAMAGTPVIDNNRAVSATALSGTLEYALSNGNGIGVFSFDNAANATLSIQLDAGANPGLEVDGSGLKAKIKSGTGLTKDADGLQLDAIPNASLTNSDVTIGSTSIALGASSLTLAGVEGIDFATKDASIAASIGANTLTLGGSTSTIRVAGDLDVVGTLNRVTETELLIEDKAVIVASGSANAAAAAGAGLKVDIDTGDMTWLYQANGENVGGVDASASGDIFVASGSAGLIDIQAASFYGNGANLTGISATDARLTVNQIADSATDDIDAAGFWLAAAQSQETTVTLNHASSWTDGDVVYIKSMNAGTNNVIIAPASGEDMEGVTNGTLLLESDGAAVTLVRAGGNAWYIV